MKCTIPEISWHNREPVLSVDMFPLANEYYRLATGGGDSHVLIWHLSIAENGAVKHEVVSDLTRHQRAVNSVRWSPNGQNLATADDDANIIIWHLKTDNIPLLDDDNNDKENWMVTKILRGHKEDIYDLCWSPDSTKLFTGSIDNTAIVWDLPKGRSEQILTDHKGFVQGVAWDPKGQYIASISTDRVCRLFDSKGKNVQVRITKGTLPVPSTHYLHEKEVKYFHDDTFKSFFRRLNFTPDGALLVVPSGHVEVEDSKKIFNGTYIFTMDNLNTPAAILPLTKQCSTVVRCCPIYFELWENGPQPIIDLPYRMIIAVGSDHDVILYDTQQLLPFARFKDIHYTRLTDLTWSHDGRLLICSSTDGFCALITFDPNELGVQFIKDDSDVEDNVGIMNESVSEVVESKEKEVKEEKKEVTVVEVKKVKKPTILEKWAIKQNKKNDAGANVDRTDVLEISDEGEPEKKKPRRIAPTPVNQNTKPMSKDNSTEPTPLVNEKSEKVNVLIPRRRITPTTISDNKNLDKEKAAQPIEVRRKPREETKELKQDIKTVVRDKNTSGTTEVELKEKSDKVNDEHTGKENAAQPIEVRRKTREETKELKEDIKTVVNDKNTTGTEVEIKEKSDKVNDVPESTTPVRRKLDNSFNLNKPEQSDNKTDIVDLTENPTSECSTPKSQDTKQKATKRKLAEDSPSARKRPNSNKTPVSRRKLGKNVEVTSPSKNSLLKFLTKSNEKTKNNATKPTSTTNDVIEIKDDDNTPIAPLNSVLEIDDSAAKDSWAIPTNDDIKVNKTESVQSICDNSCTEDFRLPLSPEKPENESDNNVKNTPLEKENVLSKDSDPDKEQEAPIENVCPLKMPRRIPLITLASPKSKKVKDKSA